MSIYLFTYLSICNSWECVKILCYSDYRIHKLKFHQNTVIPLHLHVYGYVLATMEKLRI